LVGRRRTSEGGGRRRLDSGRYWRCQEGCGNVRYDEFTGRVHGALQAIGAELHEEDIVKADDMRNVRLTLLESELASIGRKGLSPADMIKRISEISDAMEAIRAKPAPVAASSGKARASPWGTPARFRRPR
jgi:hypothetical protein